MAISKSSRTLNDIILERDEQQPASNGKRYNLNFSIFDIVFMSFYFFERTVTFEVYLQILKEVLMHVLKVEGRNNMPSHKDRGQSD